MSADAKPASGSGSTKSGFNKVAKKGLEFGLLHGAFIFAGILIPGMDAFAAAAIPGVEATGHHAFEASDGLKNMLSL